MTPPTHRLTAALADRYRLERELGQGGMATVFRRADAMSRCRYIHFYLPHIAGSVHAPDIHRAIKHVPFTVQ